MMKILVFFPRILRRFFLKRMVGNPFIIKQKSGTIHFTSVAGFAKSPGYVIPCLINVCALDVTCGSIIKKPTLFNDKILLREILSLTLMFNHAIVDGAPAARFTSRLKRIFENAEVLNS